MVSESLDEKLPFHRRVFIRMHLMMCKHCFRFRKQLLILRRACRIQERSDEVLDPSMGLSAEARERIKHTIEKNAAKLE